MSKGDYVLLFIVCLVCVGATYAFFTAMGLQLLQGER